MTLKALPLNSLIWEFFSTSFEGVDDIQTVVVKARALESDPRIQAEAAIGLGFPV